MALSIALCGATLPAMALVPVDDLRTFDPSFARADLKCTIARQH
jgi:hypothetical protein